MITFLGGTNKARLQDDSGPWKNYEIIDSSDPKANVGVKIRSTGEMFTPKDFKNLENPLVPKELQKKVIKK